VPRKRKTPRDELQREPTAATAAPTAEDWRRTIDLFLILRTLGSAASRRRVEQLAVALEREALDVFRVARQLENGVVPVLDLEERTVTHGRTSIVAKLRDFTRRYVDLAGLDVLDDPVGRKFQHWYRQGGLLLDAAERVRSNVYAYQYIEIRRPEDERGTVAWGHLIAQTKEWGASDGEVAQRLADAGYVRTELDVFNLRENVQKHRLRRAEGRMTRKTRRRRSWR
jgi:hypothetical protein